MSDHNLIVNISNGLRRLLEEEFEAAELPLEIVTKPPPEGGPGSDKQLSFWLYHITENEFVKNQPMITRSPQNGGNGSSVPQHLAKFPPLALNLYYLLTPLAPQANKDQELIGKAMEVFYDNAIVFIRASDQTLHELRITLCRMALEELTRIWDALRQPYRLSVCYQVRVAQIDSLRDRPSARVIEQVLGVGKLENALGA